MEKVSLIIKNANVLTIDEEFNQFYPGAVAIENDIIKAVGMESFLNYFQPLKLKMRMAKS